MARNFQQVVKAGVNRILFVHRTEQAAARRKPVRTKAQPTGSLFAIRNNRIAIREAALRRVQIVFSYDKVTTGERKKYICEPYSWRYRMLKSGFRKMLYAFDVEDKHIKSFVARNIRNVAVSTRKYTPRWRVEIV